MIFIKKYFLLLVVFILIVIVGFGSISLTDTKDGNANLYVVGSNESFGYFDILEVDGHSYKQIKKDNHVIGEYLEINKDKLNQLMYKLGVNIVNEYNIAGRKIVEGVSKALPYTNRNQNFNIQISICNDYVKVGTPALLDSF